MASYVLSTGQYAVPSFASSNYGWSLGCRHSGYSQPNRDILCIFTIKPSHIPGSDPGLARCSANADPTPPVRGLHTAQSPRISFSIEPVRKFWRWGLLPLPHHVRFIGCNVLYLRHPARNSVSHLLDYLALPCLAHRERRELSQSR
jgi:hypothetical protein